MDFGGLAFRIEVGAELTGRLIQIQPGETVTYTELTALIGMDVQVDGRGRLATAKKNAETQVCGLFSVVRDVGLKRLMPVEFPAEISRGRDGIRRKAVRTFRRSTKVEVSEMPESARLALGIEQTILHFVANSTGARSVKRIANAVSPDKLRLQFNETLKLFSRPRSPRNGRGKPVDGETQDNGEA